MSDKTERADFEAWVDAYNAAHTNWQFSMSSPISDHCWSAWQARAAQPAAEPQKLRKDFMDGYDAGYKDACHRIDADLAERSAQPATEPLTFAEWWPTWWGNRRYDEAMHKTSANAAWLAALAQPAASKPFPWDGKTGLPEYYAAPSVQPAAEPVAMVAISHESFGCFWLGNVPPEGTKLYAHPAPAAEPLSDAQIEDILSDISRTRLMRGGISGRNPTVDDDWRHAFARAVIAAHEAKR